MAGVGQGEAFSRAQTGPLLIDGDAAAAGAGRAQTGPRRIDGDTAAAGAGRPRSIRLPPLAVHLGGQLSAPEAGFFIRG